jgi:hypothetical protein
MNILLDNKCISEFLFSSSLMGNNLHYYNNLGHFDFGMNIDRNNF